MSEADLEHCPICKRRTARGMVKLTFHRMTDRGRVTCDVALPHWICASCDLKTLDAGAEAMMDEAVRRAYDELPPAPAKGDGG